MHVLAVVGFWELNFAMIVLTLNYICQYYSNFCNVVVCVAAAAEVWSGEYKGSKIAIKMLKDLKDSKARQQFLKEASVMT